jgi:phenylacetate-coenzyme A ligase PaaK-like adenylate-forming protein
MTNSKTVVRTARRWTKAEDATLRAGVLNGLTTKQISEQLNRTTHSVHCRKNSLGMHDVRIAMPLGISRTRKATPAVKAEVQKQIVKTAKQVKAVKVAKPTKIAKTPDMIASIAETVSRMTKQYGVKATVIVFEN